MTPKEKAKELVDKYRFYVNSKLPLGTVEYYDYKNETTNAVKCALIAVDELRKEWGEIMKADFTSKTAAAYQISYWNEVKQEIEAL